MASKYYKIFEIPKGFENILYDLGKEILRYQPDDIIDFCCLYFKSVEEGIPLNYPLNSNCNKKKDDIKTKNDLKLISNQFYNKEDEIAINNYKVNLELSEIKCEKEIAKKMKSTKNTESNNNDSFQNTFYQTKY